MSLLKKLAGETAIYGISSILGRVLNFVILTPYLTRQFTAIEYGVFTDLYSWVALLMVLFTYRMETTFFRYGRKREDLERAFSTASLSLLGTTLLLLLLLLSNAQGLAAWLQYPDHPEYVRWLALVLAFDTLCAIPFARLRLLNRPLVFAGLKVFSIVVNIVFIFFFLELIPYLSAWQVPLADWMYVEEYQLSYVFLSNLLASLSVFVLVLPAYTQVRLHFDQALWQRMLRYAGPLVVAGAAGVINQLIGNPMLKRFASDDLAFNLAQVGLYGAAAKIAILMNLFIQAFNYAAEPFFFRNADQSDSRQIYAQVAQAFTLVACLAFLGITLYMDIVVYLLGAELRAGIGVVPILLLAYLFLGLFYNFSIWYKLKDRTRVGAEIALMGAGITILFNVILIPTVGIYGPAWAALLCYGFMAGATYWRGRMVYPVDYPFRKMGLYLMVALSGYFLSGVLQNIMDLSGGSKLILNTFVLVACGLAYYRMEKPMILAYVPWLRRFQ